MSEPTTPPIRRTICSVTNFLYVGDEYLFVHRGPHKKIDTNKLNGIGGKLETGENFLDAAIRETYEETGYVVTPADTQLCGVARLQGGYADDWVWCFFKIRVPSTQIPNGTHNEEGELLWLPHDQVLTSPYELVDDLHYIFPKIVQPDGLFFFAAQMNDQEKVASYTLSQIPTISPQ